MIPSLLYAIGTWFHDLAESFCSHDWHEMNFNNYKTFACTQCGKVSSTKGLAHPGYYPCGCMRGSPRADCPGEHCDL